MKPNNDYKNNQDIRCCILVAGKKISNHQSLIVNQYSLRILPVLPAKGEPDKVVELETKNQYNQNFDNKKNKF